MIGGKNMSSNNTTDKENKKNKINIKYDNLAIPEIITGDDPENVSDESQAEESISYDSLAIPEIHIKKRK